MRTFDKDELRRRVDEVLFYVWDPIGVSPEPGARAEYENCVPEVLKLLQENDTIDLISEYLVSYMSPSKGLTPDKALCDQTAEILLGHKEAVAVGVA
jgi:hypothetical protein